MGKLTNKKEDEGLNIPVWFRYMLISIAILYLLWVMFFKSGVQREDFPFFRRF
jgi:hypothetical protein